jgi:hypothetical protein
MKNITILLLGLLFIVSSCGYDEPPVLNNPKKPFVVCKISVYDKTHSNYYNEIRTSGGRSGDVISYSRIILPNGMFNIGDVIVVKKSN